MIELTIILLIYKMLKNKNQYNIFEIYLNFFVLYDSYKLHMLSLYIKLKVNFSDRFKAWKL